MLELDYPYIHRARFIAAPLYLPHINVKGHGACRQQLSISV